MPVISYTAGKLTKEQKKKLIQELTKVSIEVTGIPEHVHTVLINELEDDSMGVGTKTIEEIKRKMK